MSYEIILNELKELKEDIRAIKSALYEADGSPGICTRLRLVEQSVGAIKRAIWLCLGGIITVGITFISVNVFHIQLP